jgi:4-carboxymuconolactone decarboxylase
MTAQSQPDTLHHAPDPHRADTGRVTYEQVHQRPAPPRQVLLDDAELSFAYGEIWSRPGLSLRDRRFVAFVASAGSMFERDTATYLKALLRAGDLTMDGLQEVMLAIAVYTGFPPVGVVMRNAITEAIADTGIEPTAPLTLANPATRSVTGAEVWQQVHGVPVRPLDDLLMSAALDFVCGEVYARPGLSMRDRRLISIIVLAGKGIDSAVRTHVRTAMSSGALTNDELGEVALQLVPTIGIPLARRLAVAVMEESG